MNELVIFIYLVFLTFEIILLFLYNASNLLTSIFFPFFLFKKNKKSEYQIKTIRFFYWIFIMFKTILGYGLMYILTKLTYLFLNNIDFSIPTISKEDNFTFLVLLLIISEFLRRTILEINLYSFCRKYYKISKIWNKIKENGEKKENEEKKETKVGI